MFSQYAVINVILHPFRSEYCIFLKKDQNYCTLLWTVGLSGSTCGATAVGESSARDFCFSKGGIGSNSLPRRPDWLLRTQQSKSKIVEPSFDWMISKKYSYYLILIKTYFITRYTMRLDYV